MLQNSPKDSKPTSIWKTNVKIIDLPPTQRDAIFPLAREAAEALQSKATCLMVQANKINSQLGLYMSVNGQDFTELIFDIELTILRELQYLVQGDIAQLGRNIMEQSRAVA